MSSEFEKALVGVFAERASDFSPDLLVLLRALWQSGCQSGIEEGHRQGSQAVWDTRWQSGRQSGIEEGRQSGIEEGHRQVELLFSDVLRGKPAWYVFRVTEVFPEAGHISMVFQPWVIEAWQQLLDAPTFMDAKVLAQQFRGSEPGSAQGMVRSWPLSSPKPTSTDLTLHSAVDMATGQDTTAIAVVTTVEFSSPSLFTREFHGTYVGDLNVSVAESGSSPSADDPSKDNR